MADPNFQFNPPDGHNNTTEFLTNPPKEAVRGYMQKLHDQTRDFFNNTLIPWIKATFATVSDLQGVVLGQIPDGTLTMRKFKKAPVISVADFGAVGDGITDDSSAIQSCIDYAYSKGGGTVLLPDGLRFKLVSSALNLKSNVKIVMGMGTVLDMTEVAPLGSYKHGIYAKGTTGESILLTSDAIKGSYLFDIANTSGLVVGDWIQIATQGVNYYPYNGTYNVDRGEIKKIRLISGNTLIFETGIYDNYTVANGAFIKKINFVENIGVVGGKIIGDTNSNSNEHGIYFEYVNGFNISEVELENQDLYQIGLASCIKGNVFSNRERMTFYDGVTGSVFYGIAILDACQWIKVFSNHGERMRHLVVTSARTSGQGFWGQPRQILIFGNTAENMQAGDNGRSYAYEHHGFGEDIKFVNNIADSCYAGFNIEGSGVDIINNTIKNWYYSAIMIEDGSVYKNINIYGNKIGDFTTEGGGFATPKAIRFTFQDGDIVENLFVENNQFNQDLVKSGAIYINASVAINAKNSSINNNKIQNTNTNIGSNYAIQSTNLNKLKIKSNQINDTYNGIYAVCTETEINGNDIDVESSRVLTAGYAIYSNGNDNWMNNNNIRRSHTGIRVNAGLTGNIISNNIIRSDNATTNDLGTSTVKQNNIEVLY